jgi:CIC family chloride channel protein
MSPQFKYIRFLLKYPVYKIFKHRTQYISNQHFLVIASIFVAVVVSFAAILLKWLIHFIESLLLNTNLLELSFANLFLPLGGILLSLTFIKFALRGKDFEKGLASIIYKVTYKKGRIELYHTYAHLITSVFTVSLGGSVGVEAPIAATGSAIGSNLASRFFLNDNDRNLLLACGASAGISAIFNSPIGAVIFALEVLLRRVTVPAFVPLLIASATASVISNFFYKSQIISFSAAAWELQAIPYYVILAAMCGFFSIYTIRVIYGIETRFNNAKLKYNKAVIQGLIVGGLILFSPLLYGEGYFVINQILHNKFDEFMRGISLQSNFGFNTVFLVFVLVTILLKPVAAGFTVSSGGNGGIFAPALFIGALSGLFFSRIVNLLGFTEVNELNFVVAGMAGLLSGVLSAPLTGIFMIAEIAGGYTLLVPLMIVSAGSFFFTRLFEPNSIYTKRLVQSGLLQKTPELELLKTVSAQSVLETNFPTLFADETLRSVTLLVSSTRRNVFPVVKRNGKLVGIVSMGDLRHYLFKADLYDKITVKELMHKDVICVNQGDSLHEVLQLLEENPGVFYLPVIHEDKYVGCISKSVLLNKYKELMQEWMEQNQNLS